MANFDDFFSWVDQDSSTNYVECALATVYDKANREETTASSPDFSACGEALFSLRNETLEANFLVTFSDRIRWEGGADYTTGRRTIWRVKLQRDGNIDVFQTGWTTRDKRLTNVERLDTGSGQFAIGHLQNRSTRALLSFSFDKVKVPILI